MKIASITLPSDDTLKIIINTGTSELIIRAATIDEKSKWVHALN